MLLKEHNKLLIIVCLVFLSMFSSVNVIGQSLTEIEFEIGDLIYENPLSSEEDLKEVIIETGKEDQPVITFKNQRMQLKSDVHFLLWFPDDFPDNIAVSWDFLPKTDDGLAMFWLSAKGREGEDLFDPSLNKREGDYPQYHSGDINAYHLAYYRRNPWDDPYFNTIHLRKSFGNKLMKVVANPIPNVERIKEPYRIQVIKYGRHIRILINNLMVLDWQDENDYLKDGKIGFRQMANLVAEYSNLRVNKVTKVINN